MEKKQMSRIPSLGFILLILVMGCTGTKKTSTTPEDTVESYIQALVDKNSSTLSSLSCADWEPSALMEFDSLQAVTVRLDGLACTETGKDGDYSLVNCTGKMIATYNGEDQSIDLSLRIYKVLKQNSDYQVCGYK